jgi:hypothetical protein
MDLVVANQFLLGDGNMPERRWSLHGFLSRVLAGGACGCAALLMADLVFITPLQLLPKGDERIETVLLIAKFGLPAAFILGAFAGLTCRWSHTFRLGPAGLVVCCLAVALVSTILRPVMSLWPPDERPPLFEVARATMAVLFCLGALVIALSRGRGIAPRAVWSVFGCWLAVALVSMILRAGNARWPPEEQRPLFEVVPDTMATLFWLGALVIAMSGAIWRVVRHGPRLRSPSEVGAADEGQGA